jgi:uncharacterized repeat protein (TIGR01451 family)
METTDPTVHKSGSRTAAIITIIVIGVLLIGGLFAWRYWGDLKGLFSKASGPDISLYPAGQAAPYPLLPCPQIADGVLQMDLTVFNNGTGTATATGATLHGVKPIGPAAGELVNIDSSLPGASAISGGSASMPVKFSGIPAGTVINLIELTYSTPDVNSTSGNWRNSEEDDDIRFSCSGDIGGGDVPPGGNNPFDLAVAKSANPTTVQVGQNTTFTVTVSNDTDRVATSASIKDTLPNTVSYVSHTTASGTYTPSNGTWLIPQIPAHGNVTLSLVVKVNSAGVHTNIAQLIASTPTDENQSNNSASASVSTTGNPPGGDLVCSPATQSVAVNQDASFTVTNGQPANSTWSAPGGTPATGSGATFKTKYAAAGDKVVTVSFQNSTGQCRVTVLAPASPTITCAPATQTVAINQNASFTATVTNGTAASSTWSAPGGTPATGSGATFSTKYADSGQKTVTVTYQNINATCAVTVSSTPPPTPSKIDLSLSKSVSNATPQIGSDIVYTVTVANSGPAVATGVKVKDDLPAGLNFKSSSASQGSYDQASDTWIIGTVNVGATATLLLTASVNQNGTITNVAEVCAANEQDSDSTPCNNVSSEDDQASVQITPTVPYAYPTPISTYADLSLSKSVSNTTPQVGANVVYSVTVYNSGPLSAGNVTVKDILPNGVSYVTSSASQGSYNSGNGIWTVGTLNSGASANIQITVTANQTGSITNVAEVCSSDKPDPDSTPCNNNPNEDDYGTATINPHQNPPPPPTNADLSLSKSVSNNSPKQNGTVVFSVTVFNSGPASASNVTVKDVLPSGLSYVSSIASQGSYDQTTGFWTVGNLAIGGSANLQLTATVTGAGTLTNTAEVCNSSQPDPDSTPCNNNPNEDDQDSETVSPTVDQYADLSLTKGVNNAKPKVGEQIVYSIYVANNGPSSASGVTVKDVLPQGLTFVSSTATGGSYNKTTGVWTIGNIGVGNTIALQITAKVTKVGTTVNTAEVCSASPQDPDSTPCNNNPNEDDYGSVSFTSEPGSTLPAAGASNSMQIFFGFGSLLAGSLIYFTGRSRKRKLQAGNVSVTTFDRFE